MEQEFKFIHKNLFEGFSCLPDSSQSEVRKALLPMVATQLDTSRMLIDFHYFISTPEHQRFYDFNIEKIEDITSDIRRSVSQFR